MIQVQGLLQVSYKRVGRLWGISPSLETMVWRLHSALYRVIRPPPGMSKRSLLYLQLKNTIRAVVKASAIWTTTTTNTTTTTTILALLEAAAIWTTTATTTTTTTTILALLEAADIWTTTTTTTTILALLEAAAIWTTTTASTPITIPVVDECTTATVEAPAIWTTTTTTTASYYYLLLQLYQQLMNVTTATVEAPAIWTIKGSGSHSLVNASTAYSAKDMQMMASWNIILIN